MGFTVQLLANRAAGTWSSRRADALVRAFQAAGARVIVSNCDSPIHPDAEHVCVIGGDGTLRHVATAAAATGRKLSISIYPAGTVNLIARECEYSRDAATFVSRVLAGAPSRRHHIGLVGDVMLFGVASVGPDSWAVEGLNLRLKRLIGRAAYLVSFLKLLWRWPRPRLRIDVDGRILQGEAVYIAKGKFFAGPWSFAPDAAVGLPLLHVVILHRARRRDFAGFVWTMWRGNPLAGRQNVSCFACTDLTIAADTALPLQADGDIVAYLPVHVRLAAETLAFA